MPKQEYNFYTDTILIIDFKGKKLSVSVGIYADVKWTKSWIPIFTPIKYVVNEVKCGEEVILKYSKELLTQIEYFWNNCKKETEQALKEEYMDFAYICENQRKQSSPTITKE